MDQKQEHPRITREHTTIDAMLSIYCQKHHGTRDALCPQCAEFLDYAHRRLSHCRYGEHKPTCGNCPKHCYKPSRLAQAMTVMKFSGPRMIFKHPYLALCHLRDGLRKAPEIQKKCKV
jgi:hypothetical protein